MNATDYLDLLYNDCPNVNALLYCGWDAGDTFGSALSEAFAICDYAYFNRDDISIPDSLQYIPSVCGPDTDNFEYQLLVEYGDNIDSSEFERYQDILNEFLDQCDDEGLSY